MFDSLKIKSLNAACYISAMTGEQAEVIKDYRGWTHFAINQTSQVMDAYHNYRAAMDDGGELQVDLVKFKYYIREYDRAMVENDIKETLNLHYTDEELFSD